jgi:glycosyltransferase involved in cell wall biosynthesis
VSRVTIILPVHNGENYLAEAIASVVEQDCIDWILHVLDDGSTDGSAAIAQGFAAKDPRVFYSKNPEKFGLFRTLNRGCGEALTKWVRIWAHDDRMLPSCISTMLDFAENNPNIGMLYCNFFEIDASGKRTGNEKIHDGFRDSTPDVAPPLLSALLFYLYGCLPGNISTVMLRRDAWEAVGGFLEGIQQAPDYDMWVRISEKHDVGFIRARIIELRAHELQLGRIGQKQMTTIAEERPVIEGLRNRLDSAVPKPVLNRYWRNERGRQHVHWVVRSALRRQFSLTRKGWTEIRKYGQPFGQLWRWAVTLNGRIGMSEAGQIYRTYAPNLLTTPGRACAPSTRDAVGGYG